jgi:hypothetical protein
LVADGGRSRRGGRSDERKDEPMKLTTVSVDGAMQGLGGPDEDPTDGFEQYATATAD